MMLTQGASMLRAHSTKDRMIAVATDLLDKGGPNSVTLRGVGDALSLSRTAPYRHFRDKRGLLEAVVAETFRQMDASFTEVQKQESTPQAALKSVIRKYLEFARRFPARYRLLLSDPDIGCGAVIEGEARRAFETLCRLVQAVRREGGAENRDPATVAALIWGAAHGLADLEQGGRIRIARDAASLDDLAEDLLDLAAGRSAG